MGSYVPGSGTLLLSAVQFADSTGAGGYVTGFTGSHERGKPGAADQRIGLRSL